MKGKVKFFNGTKGFGFVAGDDGTEYFVHLTGLKPGVRLRDNDTVTFDVEQGDRGPKAVNVSVSSDDSAQRNEPAQDESSDEESEDSDDYSDEE